MLIRGCICTKHKIDTQHCAYIVKTKLETKIIIVVIFNEKSKSSNISNKKYF